MKAVLTSLQSPHLDSLFRYLATARETESAVLLLGGFGETLDSLSPLLFEGVQGYAPAHLLDSAPTGFLPLSKAEVDTFLATADWVV